MLKGPSRGLKIQKMKKSLQFASGFVLLLFHAVMSNGQIVILSENFSGFTTGTHSTPSTNDVSLSLDSRTSAPGWKGNLIYSAGGEIKIGTSSLTGWIETPPVDLSVNSGNCKVAFDIARWTGDAATVQVYLDGVATWDKITPTDNYERIEIPITTGTSSSRIKIQALTKRFYIDNLIVTTNDLPTSIGETPDNNDKIRIWPVPAADELNISGMEEVEEIDLHDFSGRMIRRIPVNYHDRIVISVSELDPGIYLLIFRSVKDTRLIKFIKR
jgi:hypothetical protein